MEIATLHVIAAWCVLIYANTLKIDKNYTRVEYLGLKAMGIVGLALAVLEWTVKTVLA